MTQLEFKNEMIVLKEASPDPEAFHSEADDLMCKLLRELGYGDGIEIFENHEKWYS